MQNAHDPYNAVGSIAAENYVAALRELAIAGFDVVAVLSGLKVPGQKPERVIKLLDVQIPLILAPALLGMDRYPA